MNEKLINTIKSLPPLPKTVLEVQRITQDENASLKDLVKVLKEDPMLTANLLKVANSPLYGFTKKVKSIDQAVTLFGMTAIKGFVISYGIRNSMKFDLSAYGIDENQFHDISHKRNALAFNWYKGDKKLDTISTNSFLLDIGAIIISLLLNVENKTNEFRNKLSKNNREELEQEFIGANTLEITYEVFKHWHFSEDMIESIGYLIGKSNKFEEEAHALDVIRTIFNMLGEDEKDYSSGFKKAENYNLNIEKLKKAFEIVQEGN